MLFQATACRRRAGSADQPAGDRFVECSRRRRRRRRPDAAAPRAANSPAASRSSSSCCCFRKRPVATRRCRSAAATRRPVAAPYRAIARPVRMATSIASPTRACGAVRAVDAQRRGRRHRGGSRQCHRLDLPLQRPRLIELPLEHQRRVAVMAAVAGRNAQRHAVARRAGRRPSRHHARVVARRSVRRRAGVRRRRWSTRSRPAAHRAERSATVLAGDLNTWLGADDGSCHACCARPFHGAVDVDRQPTWIGPLGLHATLDHIFVRGAASPVRDDAAAEPVRIRSLPAADHARLLTALESSGAGSIRDAGSRVRVCVSHLSPLRPPAADDRSVARHVGPVPALRSGSHRRGAGTAASALASS